MAYVLVCFDSQGTDEDGVEWGTVVTYGYDPIEYDITREQYDAEYPDNIWEF